MKVRLGDYSYTYTQTHQRAWVDFGRYDENVRPYSDLGRHLAYYGFRWSNSRRQWYCDGWIDYKKFRRVMDEFAAHNRAKLTNSTVNHAKSVGSTAKASLKGVSISAQSVQQPAGKTSAFIPKRQIVYQAPKPLSPDNPFDLLAQPASIGLNRALYNNLLSWLSATGEGSWNVFRQTCAELGLTRAGEIRHLFRRLRLLGHVEYLDDGQRWVVAPPCLVQVATTTDDKYVCFLVGARTPRLLEQFASAMNSVQAIVDAPDRVQLTFDTRDEAEQIAMQITGRLGPIHVVGPTALQLIDVLPDIEEWRQVLRRLFVPVERYKIMRWDGQGFNQWVARPTEVGMYQLNDIMAGDTAPTYYLFYDTEDSSWLQGDWYGLRYIANLRLGYTAQLLYRPQEGQLYVPNSHRLPDLYERVLVLASGMLPTAARQGVIFHTISPDLATILSKKIQAQLKEVV